MKNLMHRAESKTVLIVGQGSIGRRHARVLQEAGANVSIVSRHASDAFRSIGDALSAKAFEYVVICNETNRHMAALDEVRAHGFRGIILIEKPISDRIANAALGDDAIGQFSRIAVAYNLRFHPLIDRLRQWLAGKRILTVEMHVGQHLATWRESADFRKDSSALLAAGGGVLRDLSHELDLAIHLFGMPDRLVATGGNLGALDIETDEAWTLLLAKSGHGPISIHLNYFDKPAQRYIHVNTPDGTIRADFVAGQLESAGTIEKIACDRDFTYQALHSAVLGGDVVTPCTAQQAMAVMRLIEAAEESQRTQKWIET